MRHEQAATEAVAGLAWHDGQCILSLRGRPDDVAFLAATQAVLGLALPLGAGGTSEREHEDGRLRVIWAGPDDWFVISPHSGQAATWMQRLRQALAGVHAAVTDVSSGYTVLRLAEAGARELLASGCPLDLHPRAFAVGQCAGTHFHKASVWLWRLGGDAGFEMLVRRSFKGYVALMLGRA